MKLYKEKINVNIKHKHNKSKTETRWSGCNGAEAWHEYIALI